MAGKSNEQWAKSDEQRVTRKTVKLKQKMVDLPYFRTAKAPPFTFCRVDMFCPFIIKQRKSQVKRYEAITICLSSRAVHFEKSHSLVTNSFILALNRLAARRENMQTNFSDNGNNFIGSENGLRSALEELDKEKLQFFMQASGGDLVTWKWSLLYTRYIWVVFGSVRSVQLTLSLFLWILVLLEKRILAIFQGRKKWINIERKVNVGGNVILRELNTIRNDWQICRVIQTHFYEKRSVRNID